MASDPTSLNALLVEGDATVREVMTSVLRDAGYRVQFDTVATLEQLRGLLPTSRYAVALAEYPGGDWAGEAVLAELRRRDEELPIIMVTPSLTEEMADAAIRAGAVDFVLHRNVGRLPGAVRRAAEYRESRDQLRRSVEQIRTLSVAVDQGPAAVLVTDTQGRIQYVNRRFTEITGYTPAEALGQTPRILASGKTQLQVYQDLWSTIGQGNTWRSEILNRRKSGELYWSAVSISPMRGTDGVPTHFVAIHEDVSQRKYAEEEIREREERFRHIADNINEVFFVADADLARMHYISPAYAEVFGRTCESLYQSPTSFLEAIHPDDRPRLVSDILVAQGGGDPGPIEIRVVRPDGDTRWVRVHGVPVFNQSGEVYRLAGVALDITDRVRAEERRLQSEERFRKLVEASFDVIVQSVDGIIREASIGWTETVGYSLEETIGRPIVDFVTTESRDEVERRIAHLVEGRYEVELRHKNGRKLLLEATAKYSEVDGRKERITALRDITERRTLEEQLRQAQKLEAVARLAGGVAHDFNNVLTVILTEIELLKLTGGSGGAELPAALAEMEGAARRAAALTRQLLTFSRRDVASPRELDPVEVVKGLEKMLTRLIGEDIGLAVIHPDRVGSVFIDRGHLEQVIVNMAVNARDAMPNGGELRIELKDVELDDRYAKAHAEVEAGSHVMIAVSDNGAGMSPEVQRRVFEPFFTTKPSGKGTGLGLATSYGIVREAGGHINIYSEVGVGTTFKVLLPLVAGGASFNVVDAAVQVVGPIEATVLVVEDEDAVRRSAVRALEMLGCRVVAASNGIEALQVIDDVGERLDLMFTDVIMPGMSGPDLAAAARQRIPSLRVLFTTGYTADMATRLRLIEADTQVLPKPYTAADLGSSVRRVLGMSAQGSA